MRTIRVYRSYNFVTRDPILDVVRQILDDSGESYKKVHELSGVSATTLHNWTWGQTKRPQHATIAAVVYALGGRIVVLDNHGVEIKPPKTPRAPRRRRRRKNGA